MCIDKSTTKIKCSFPSTIRDNIMRRKWIYNISYIWKETFSRMFELLISIQQKWMGTKVCQTLKKGKQSL